MNTTKKELERALDMACSFIYDVSGTCPWDQFDEKPVACEKECKDDSPVKCFAKHFIRKARQEIKRRER